MVFVVIMLVFDKVGYVWFVGKELVLFKDVVDSLIK